MVAKHLAVALLGSALIAAPALAQTSSGSGTTTNPSTSTAPAMNTNTGSSSMGSGNTMTQMQPGQWRASKLEGLNVYNNNNEKIGDISELLVDESGKIQAVVVGVGGFLGMGEHDVAIPFEQVKFVNEPRANASAANTAPAGTGNTATTTTAPNTTGSVAPSTGTAATTGSAADRSAPDHAMVNMTKDQLKGMPEFKYNR